MGGPRLGLIIGNQGYDDPLLATLQAPRLDVELLAAALRDAAAAACACAAGLKRRQASNDG
jgi:hypothetical protein